jgi:hypothetical protein
VRHARRATPTPVLDVELTSSIAPIAAAWDAVVPAAQVLHRAAYLAVQERSLAAAGVGSRYALVWRGGAPVAACPFHVLRVGAADAAGGASLRALGDRLALTLVVAGNVLVTGASAIIAAPGVGGGLAGEALVRACTAVEAREARSLGALVVKDVPADVAASAALRAAGFTPIALEPSMRLDVAPSWRRLDDYARALRSKYRRRLRGVRQSAAHVERRRLDAASARVHAATIDRLYGAVHARARHGGPRFGGDHFVELAAALAPGDYELVGYFEHGALVGWNSRYRLGDDIASSFFGFERGRGDALGLFRNLMYDDLEHAFATGARCVHLGRTTHAIKSELGAVPEALPCFIRPLSPLARPLCWAARSLYRAPQWTPRNPFAAPPSRPSAP